MCIYLSPRRSFAAPATPSSISALMKAGMRASIREALIQLQEGTLRSCFSNFEPQSLLPGPVNTPLFETVVNKIEGFFDFLAKVWILKELI
ncbi:hypothetical protein EJB05_01966 [Eragrostis curvula]|uniref:Uncharacterized protein n=1 Tax=Eragrostis curvula TaxID=38414 RepID=A0A5J9WQX6_9POAL|nr:hypothetical protein EJB05_01966 [Eragrostis curvula]